MPQLDKISISSTIFWSLIAYFVFYVLIVYYILPGILRNLKYRQYKMDLLSKEILIMNKNSNILLKKKQFFWNLFVDTFSKKKLINFFESNMSISFIFNFYSLVVEHFLISFNFINNKKSLFFNIFFENKKKLNVSSLNLYVFNLNIISLIIYSNFKNFFEFINFERLYLEFSIKYKFLNAITNNIFKNLIN